MRYKKLYFRAESEDFHYPFFIGSTIRGALGYAMKKVVCINPSYNCEGCFARKNCLYFECYEFKNSIHKFRFDFELNLDKLEFSLYLFENMSDDLPYVLMSVVKMLKENGLGRNRTKFEIKEVKCNDKSIFDGVDFDLDSCKGLQYTHGNFFEKIKLKFITPLRIKENNRFARNDIKLETILKSIKYRLSELENSNNRRLGFEPKYERCGNDIRFVDFNRYSNRQETKMNIGGIMGEIIYDNLDKESFELLKVGEIIGVGKSTVFGLGKIKIEELR